jgi:uncharacterized protein (TIGR02246 family)
MKIRLVVALVGLAMSIALPTFAQQQSTVDPEVRQGIEAVLTRFGEAFNKRDAAAMAALYTQEAVQLWTWMPIEEAVASGRRAIEKRYEVMLSSSPGTFTGQIVEVYVIGNDMAVVTKAAEGTLWKGYKVWICVPDADTWKIRMEYVN